jgi:uncharacterized protein YjeT (DUF2065 family)
MKNVGVPLLVGIFVCVGGYLLLRPQRYKDELAQFEHVISRFPSWAIRILGVFIMVVGIGVFYLFLRSPK